MPTAALTPPHSSNPSAIFSELGRRIEAGDKLR
jgi:hypothetical protein